MEQVRNEFIERHQSYTAQAITLKQKVKSIAWARVISFSLAITFVVILANRGDLTAVLGVTIAFFVAFVILLKRHQKVKEQLQLVIALVEVNNNEIKRLDFNLSELPKGDQFHNVHHPFHEDLDIFGRHSLFQLLNRSASKEGEALLAQWISSHAEPSEIKARQEAIKEIAQRVSFRQDFEANGKLAEDEEGDKAPFIEWLNKSESIKAKWLYQTLLIVMPIATIGSVVLASMGLVENGVPLLIIAINMVILGTVFQRIGDITKQTENGYKSLSVLKQHLFLIEQEEFKSDKLVHLKAKLTSQAIPASKSLQGIKFILENLQSRANMLYAILDIFLLLDVFWLLKVVAWKKENRIDIQQWYGAVAEFDALNSMAGYAYANPTNTFPAVKDKGCKLYAEGMGHPLINATKRVSNDFDFNGKGGICLVTGSNMSGKSTFLRTVGLNVVLAQIGAPVCASHFEMSPTRVFTSMRTTDELEESVSSFYAELKRLRKLLESINEETPTLFMIDEVLKGTNSEDRHKGAIALVKQLNKTNAFGLVSTHDIVLGNLTNELTGVKNYSFNSEIVKDEIIFDYKLTPGICKSFNATKLMQKMGIEIPE